MRAAKKLGILASLALSGAALGQSFRKLDNYHPFLVGYNSSGYQISDDGRYATGKTTALASGVVKWDYSSVTVKWGNPITYQNTGIDGGISGDGSRVAGTVGVETSTAFQYDYEGAYIDNGSLQIIPRLPGTIQNFVDDISVDGNVLIGHSAFAAQNNLAVYSCYLYNVTAGSLTDIGFFGPPGTAAWIRANGDGSVVLGTGTGLSSYWTLASGWTDIPGPLTFGYEVSDNGRYICGTSKFNGGGFRGLIYDIQTGTMTDLGTLGGYCDMYAMTDDARIAVGTSNDLTTGRAVWWRQGIGLTDLNADFASIIPAGWHLWEARGITPDGRYILGTATNDLGTHQAYVIDTVPEPGTILALSLGITTLALRRRVKHAKK